MRLVLCTLASALSFAAAGCGTELRALDRADRAFTRTRYDVAGPLLASLSEASSRFEPADRARYSYLRGMSAYRTSDWRTARLYLGLAVAIADLDPGTLDESSAEKAAQALERMDRVVFREGYSAAKKAPSNAFDPESSGKAKTPARNAAQAPESAPQDDGDDE